MYHFSVRPGSDNLVKIHYRKGGKRTKKNEKLKLEKRCQELEWSGGQLLVAACRRQISRLYGLAARQLWLLLLLLLTYPHMSSRLVVQKFHAQVPLLDVFLLHEKLPKQENKKMIIRNPWTQYNSKNNKFFQSIIPLKKRNQASQKQTKEIFSCPFELMVRGSLYPTYTITLPSGFNSTTL
ncbi:hypothetical protein M9H77_08909 [Catharanthus roseus]|uniref:Uncharacterized protein n=1 Tax=Catharanthus roseus TaxID=4058 RepID=A0ACC0BZ34_CATRO|nr:hypothetical protein M9H77_08909 [Catharanthus roseus]